jgi:hypothetical protein
LIVARIRAMTKTTVPEPLYALSPETCRAVIDGISDPLKRERFIDALDHYDNGSLEAFLFSSINALIHAYEDGAVLGMPARFAPVIKHSEI